MPGNLAQIGELARWFHAETLELTAEAVVLHLTATPGRCSAFVSMLRPHGVVEVTDPIGRSCCAFPISSPATHPAT
ncbi:hypothetical protein [Amycolatopsis pigmentata]|uniref:Acetolactate synthase small subunit C-terminal domain-containing protein n=1 Tax=Amycolatopsis pigmentata TaxID=450801 RepID=A0ABW5FLW5_9PSEU